jgi:phage tail sheath protein FI
VIIDFGVQDGSGGPLLPSKKVPASVAALGVIARTDDLMGPHAAPMGFVRGKVIGSKDIEIEFEDSEISALIKNNINPILDIVSPPDTPDGMTIISQATMALSDGSLDRIGNRRLLLFVRRGVRNIARQILFEPKEQSLVRSFKKSVGSFLTNLQTNQMILDFEIVMRQNIIRTSQTNNLEINIDKFKPFGGLLNRTNDETEMKTIRGSIFIVPIESSERIKIDIDESSE